MASEASLRLYQHVDQLEVVLEWLEEHADEIEAAGGELPPELEQLLEEVQGDVREKIGQVGLVILNLTASAKAAEAESKRLADRRKSWERQANSLKTYLLMQLQRIGAERVDTSLCKVRRQANPPVIRPADPNAIPERYLIIPEPPPPEFNRALALQDLKATDLLPKQPTTEPFVTDGIAVEIGEHVRVW